jgi:hypothetical protein
VCQKSTIARGSGSRHRGGSERGGGSGPEGVPGILGVACCGSGGRGRRGVGARGVCARGTSAAHSGGSLRGASEKGQGGDERSKGAREDARRRVPGRPPRDSIKNLVSAGVVLG